MSEDSSIVGGTGRYVKIITTENEAAPRTGVITVYAENQKVGNGQKYTPR